MNKTEAKMANEKIDNRPRTKSGKLAKKPGRKLHCPYCRKPKGFCECDDRGRPTVMTPEVIAKLEEAFKMDCTDLEACLHAGIGKDALYRYQKINPEFAERKEKLKNTPFLIARKTIVQSLGDPDYAFDYMKHKKNREFSTRQETAGEVTITVENDEIHKKIREIVGEQ